MKSKRLQDILKVCKDNGILESKQLIKDIRCGIHSGIKDCCIIHWLNCYIKHYTCSSADRIYHRKHPNDAIDINYFETIKHMKDKDGNYIQYIPCKVCLKNKDFVKIKECNCWKTSNKPLEEIIKSRQNNKHRI